jgi:hypothetical protein
VPSLFNAHVKEFPTETCVKPVIAAAFAGCTFAPPTTAVIEAKKIAMAVKRDFPLLVYGVLIYKYSIHF